MSDNAVSRDAGATVRAAVRRDVYSGFFHPDEIVENVTEAIFWENEIDLEWLRGEIGEQFRRKQTEEKHWSEITDCDRLDAVCDALEADGIMALQNAGYTQENGLDDVAQFYREAGGERSGFDGFCFYHGQDLERVMESGELWLTFGHMDGDNAKGVAVGQRIKATFEAAGFEVGWDGSIHTRLLVKGINWQRRGADEG